MRTDPAMASSHPLHARCQWLSRLALVLDRLSTPRLAGVTEEQIQAAAERLLIVAL
jgi:hypothetical protein